MYTENLGKDVFLFVKACLSNQLARFAPKLYIRLTHETGRGEGEENTTQVADYFIQCFHDYREQIGLNEGDFKDFLKGKTILEYGPGDILGVALLMYAHGAKSVHCVDRFPLENITDKNIRVYRAILDMLNGEEKERACHAFKLQNKPESGFDQNVILYSVTKDGLVRKKREYNLILSRAVLEHVNCLEMTINDITEALKKGGISVHNVDLRSHGLDRYQPLDFLTWPEMVYRLMHSYKGFPNRWRVNKYREIVGSSGLRIKNLVPTGRLEVEKIDRIRPKLAKTFRSLQQEDLSLLGFWMVLEHA